VHARITLNNFGRASAGCPRITNNREFSLRKFWSRSSRHCSRNLKNRITKHIIINWKSWNVHIVNSEIHPFHIKHMYRAEHFI